VVLHPIEIYALRSMILGTIVKGAFHCRKSANNKRELDVEIHYEVFPPDVEGAEGKGKAVQGGGVTVQMFKVR
jgi:protein arginine N-methyltransferase 3